MKNIGRKILTVGITAALVATSLVGLTSCKKNSPANNNIQPTAKDVFSMAAASGATMLEGSSQGGAQALAALQAGEQRPIDDATFDTVKTYLAMFDDMLVGGIKQESSPSDNPDYETKLTISIGDKVAYNLYYTEKGMLSNKVVEENDDDDEVKETTSLEGILVDNDNNVFGINGKRVVETDEDGEVETEIEFITKGQNNQQVKVKQEHSVDPNTGEEETEYEYTVTDELGNIVTYSIEWEFEEGSTEMEVGIEKDEVEVEYSVKKISDTKLEISYEVEEGEVEKEHKFYATKNEDGTYNFEYENGYDKDVNVVVNK